jgi:hypothetical protein
MRHCLSRCSQKPLMGKGLKAKSQGGLLLIR